jgi:NADH dehydrogenase
MKNTQEAISIRNHVLMTFEKLILKKAEVMTETGISLS